MSAIATASQCQYCNKNFEGERPWFCATSSPVNKPGVNPIVRRIQKVCEHRFHEACLEQVAKQAVEVGSQCACPVCKQLFTKMFSPQQAF